MAPQASLDEMRALLGTLPGPDLDSATAVLERMRHLPVPPGALGRLTDLVQWLAAWQGRAKPRLDHPRIALFAGNHGIAARTLEPTEAVAGAVEAVLGGTAVLNRLCEAADADLRLYEMALDRPTADFTQGPAMAEDDCARAMAYGMMAAEPGLDLLILGSIGAGGETAALALGYALLGGATSDWVAPGPLGERRRAVIEQVAALHRAAMTDPFEALRRLGGVEIAATAGAILAARRGRIPVLLDGLPATAAALVLHQADRRAIDHCRFAQLGPEPGQQRMVAALDQAALLDLGLTLSDGSGGALALGVLRGAITGLTAG